MKHFLFDFRCLWIANLHVKNWIHLFNLKVALRSWPENEMTVYLVSWPCRHFSLFLSSYRGWDQQHACLLGNNCAGWGPRLPWTTMVCFICHLRDWLELRSFPFMSAGPCLLLRTLLPLCHFRPSPAVKEKPTIWAHTELDTDAETRLDIPLF